MLHPTTFRQNYTFFFHNRVLRIEENFIDFFRAAENNGRSTPQCSKNLSYRIRFTLSLKTMRITL